MGTSSPSRLRRRARFKEAGRIGSSPVGTPTSFNVFQSITTSFSDTSFFPTNIWGGHSITDTSLPYRSHISVAVWACVTAERPRISRDRSADRDIPSLVGPGLQQETLHCKGAGALSLSSEVIDHSRQQLCVQVNGRGQEDAAYSDKSLPPVIFIDRSAAPSTGNQTGRMHPLKKST